MNAENLLLSLFKCERVKAIDMVLRDNNLLDDDNWRPIGGDQFNFTRVGSHGTTNVGAIIEKITNAQDAVLEKFEHLTGLDLAKMNAAEMLRSCSECGVSPGDAQVNILCTGDGIGVNLTIQDNGIGQPPDAFPVTFFKMGESEKRNKEFCQGRYGHGSIAIANFCAYQILVSKRIGSGVFGFSVVRQREENDDTQAPVLEYLAPGGKIIEFAKDSVSLIPGAEKFGGKIGESGTLLKLVECENIPQTSATGTTRSIYARIKEYLPRPELPINVVELRPLYENASRELSCGNKSALARMIDSDAYESIEPFPLRVKLDDDPDKNSEVRIYPLIPKSGRELEMYQPGLLVYLSGGQLHASLPRHRFMLKDEYGLADLADDSAILVDCSDLHYVYRNRLFLTTRGGVTEKKFVAQSQDMFAAKVAGNEGIAKILGERKSKYSFTASGHHHAEFYSSFSKQDISLIKESLHGNELGGASESPLQHEAEYRTDLRARPTYFRFAGLDDGDILYKEIPEDQNRLTVRFETDAKDDYFTRSENNAMMHVRVKDLGGDWEAEPIVKKPGSYLKLRNGICTVVHNMRRERAAGDVFEFTFMVDDGRERPFISLAETSIGPEKEKENDADRKTGTDYFPVQWIGRNHKDHAKKFGKNGLPWTAELRQAQLHITADYAFRRFAEVRNSANSKKQSILRRFSRIGEHGPLYMSGHEEMACIERGIKTVAAAAYLSFVRDPKHDDLPSALRSAAENSLSVVLQFRRMAIANEDHGRLAKSDEVGVFVWKKEIRSKP